MMILKNKEFDGQPGLLSESESFGLESPAKEMKVQKKKNATTTQKVYRLGATFPKSGLLQETGAKRLTRRAAQNKSEAHGDEFNSEAPIKGLFDDSFDSGEIKKSQKKIPQTQQHKKNDGDESKPKKKAGSGNPKALLNLLSNSIENDPGKPRVRAGKNRDNLLYRNLNQLMAGKELQGAAGARTTSTKQQPAEFQKRAVEHYNLINDLEEPEIRILPSPGSLKHNLVHSSLTSLQQKISQNLMKANEKVVQKPPKIWNTKRDLQLMKLYKIYGDDWEAISEAMDIPELTPEVIEERYNFRLYSNISKPRFTLQEDQIIAQHYAKVGPNWKKIKEFLPGRTEAMIRNRFNSKIKKKNLYNFLKQHALNSSESQSLEEPYIEESTASGHNYTAEKISRKSSDPTAEHGTLETVDVYGKCCKKLKRDMNVQTPTKTQSEVHSPECVYIGSHDNEVQNMNFHAQCFKSMEEKPIQSYEQPLNDFTYGASMVEDNTKRIASPLREGITPSPFMKPVGRTMEQDYWDPFNFGNDLELDRKDPQGFMDFDNNSIIGGQMFNDQRGQQKYVDLLDFKEADTFEMREHPLTPIDETPQMILNKQFKDDMITEEQTRTAHFQDFDQGFVQSTQPKQPEFDELATAAKLTQLQSLLSHIRSIEMLFDRTKQEISKLQNRIMPN